MALYKQKGKKMPARGLFKQLAEDHGYREYDLHGFCRPWNKKASPFSIGSRISQKLAKRAFQAVGDVQAGEKEGKARASKAIGSFQASKTIA